MHGSVDGALARLADLRGDLDSAIDRYEQAIGASSTRELIWATNHRRRLGEALHAAGRTEEGSALLATAKRQAPAMGLTRIARLAQEPRDRS